jgi:hypothetical protein
VANPATKNTEARLSIGPSQAFSNLRSWSAAQGSDFAYQRAEVIAMPQKSNQPGNAERSSIPQDQDDELEMAEDSEEFDEDDEDLDDDSEVEEDDVEE